MKAKIKPRIDIENRTKLETVIPMDTPFIIFVDPSDKCNFQCKFCPTGDRNLMKRTPGRNFGNMDFYLFKKIVDDICQFPEPIKVLRLYKDGEPLLNPDFPEMIRYAKSSGCCNRIDTTTNASLLGPELSKDIIDAGLTRINISIEGVNQEQYNNFSKFQIDFKKLVGNIEYFYKNRGECEVIVKINGDILSEKDKEIFYNTFGDIADGVFIESIMSCWPEFELNEVKANEDVGIYGQEIKEVLVCPYIFYSFAINSNGTASACFLDWERKLILGNAINDGVQDIWNSKKLKDMQIEFLKGNRKKHHTCGKCGQLTHGMPDDIDQSANYLLEKMERVIR